MCEPPMINQLHYILFSTMSEFFLKAQDKVMNFMRKTGSRREDEEKKHPPVSYRRHGWLTEEEEGGVMTVEREHMFDKVVTPSDVGKLNRLVIPKQHAERYFPLDSSSNEKGLLLNFEDRNGKKWWFRYSYWTSSQSYVMTKGWSRFVKEKNLDAGDVVSFHRGVGVSAKDRLFIDWKRRVTPFDHNLFNPPTPNSNTSSYTTSTCSSENVNNGGSRSLAYFRQQQHFEMIQMQQRSGFGIGINPPPPTPTIHGKASGKRIRLFGVNMDYYPLSEDEHDKNYDTPSESGHAIVAAYSTINPFSTGHYKFCHRLSPRPLVIPQSSSSSPPSSSIPYLQLSLNGEGEGRNRSWIFQASSAHAINIIDISTASRMSLDLNI